jgi:TolB-like protein/tetratricopeptide (TPR) repeat protein
MASDTASEVKLEIGHVLFIDIVGYSQLLITQQSEQIETLRRIVRGTAQFRAAEAEGKVLRLPTGDGAALVFRTTPEAPVLCALEIARELKKHPELQVRMGIHSGPVSPITDLNEQANIAGAGINIAQRVMDCGDAGHILLSKHVAEDLEHYPRWKPYLHDLGQCEVKHGVRISVVNFYTDEVGNPALPEKFKTARPTITEPQPKRTKPVFALAIGIGVLAVIAVFASLLMPGLWRSNEKAKLESAEVLPIPAKSIAVLPFENLSRDPDNAYFVEGIQDEILTRLSKIADLKVISRTSTQKYKSAPENLRDVARQLGVANILEGSVQKSNDKVRVNVQLINALTDAHLWADTYDRHLTDIFAVESEIAKTIAETLQARLTGSEKAMIAAQPTSDTTAYELYHKGRSHWEKRSGDNLPKAIAFYEQAIARDPKYALAYAGLANSYVLLPLYFSVPQRDAMAKAREAALKALEIDPKLAEAHNALGKILNFDDLDLAGAAREFQRAIEIQPNNATAHQWYGNGPLDSLGRFEEAIAETKRAVELDPLSPIINTDRAYPLYYARRYDEAMAQSKKTIELDPAFFYSRQILGMVLQAKADLPGAIAEFEKARQLSGDPLHLSLLAVAKTKMGDKNIAQQVLAELDKVNPDRQGLAYDRALIYLGMGNKEEALRWLEQSYADRDGANLSWINVEPMLDPLRGDPRFEALVQKVIAPKSESKP